MWKSIKIDAGVEELKRVGKFFEIYSSFEIVDENIILAVL